MTRTIAVIPAGGAGTRLWPRSRRSTPKHALPLGGGGRPLLRDAYERALAVADEVFVLTEERQREIIAGVLPEVDPAHMIMEPLARGTTNAYGLAALTLVERNPDAVMLTLPADHVVRGKAQVATRGAHRGPRGGGDGEHRRHRPEADVSLDRARVHPRTAPRTGGHVSRGRASSRSRTLPRRGVS